MTPEACSMTSEACVRALVRKSPVMDDAPAVHKHLQLLASPEGRTSIKRKRVRDAPRETLEDRVSGGLCGS
jgi:hypothetical protein